MTPAVIRIEITGEPKGVGRGKAAAVPVRDRGTGALVRGPNGQVKFRGTVFTPEETRTETGVIRMFAQEAMKGRVPLDGAVDVRISAFMAIPKSMSKKMREGALSTPPTVFPTKRPDFDNIAKYVDALKSVVWRDDTQVVDFHEWKRYSDKPRIIIEVRSKVGEL